MTQGVVSMMGWGKYDFCVFQLENNDYMSLSSQTSLTRKKSIGRKESSRPETRFSEHGCQTPFVH